MLERLFPRSIDDTFAGPRIALWILGLVTFVKTAMGLNSIINGHTVLSTADGVPLATYPAAAAQTIVALFAIWAWGHLLLASLGALTLVRYRGLTTLVFALLLTEHVGRKLILQKIPIVRSHNAPASWINAALLTVMVIGLLLSMWRHPSTPAPSTASSSG